MIEKHVIQQLCLPAVFLLLALCQAACLGPGGSTEIPEPISEDDFVAVDTDFECLNNWDIVDRMAITNRKGQLAEALDLAANPIPGQQFPVGTIIQEIPQEAMVKRASGYDPLNNDWEYFALTVSNQGTTILGRGTGDVANIAGSCLGCHSSAANFDFICGKDNNHGCIALPFTDAKVIEARANDPRCLN